MLVFVVSTICIGGLYMQAREAQILAVRNKLERLAREGSALVDGEAHQSLAIRGQEDSAAHARALQPLVRFHGLFPELAHVYTTVLDVSEIRYVLNTQSNSPTRRTGGMPSIQPILLDVHDLPSVRLKATYENDSVRTTPKPFNDKLGTFMSGFAPIRDTSGEVVGLFGINANPKDFAPGFGTLRRAASMSVFVALVIAFCVGFATRFFRRAALEKTRLWQQAEAGKHESEKARSVLVETLERNLSLLHAAAEVNNLLLKTCDLKKVLPQALATIGEASRAHRAYFVATLRDASSGHLLIDERFHWQRSVESEGEGKSTSFDFYAIEMTDWLSKLRDGQVINAVTDHLPETHQLDLKTRNVRSIVLIPVMGRDSFAGFVGFEDTETATLWTNEETAILRSLASNLGSSLLRSHSELEKEQSRDLLNGILDSSIDGIIALRAIRDNAAEIEDFEFIQTNAAAQQIFKKSAKELAGARFLSVNPSGPADGLFEAFAGVAHTGETFSLEMPFSNHKPLKWMHIAATQLGDGVAVTFSDISEQKQVELDHLRAKEGAEAADRAKSEFLAVMSHEIRTPMNGVIGFTTLLQDTNLDESQREFVETIRRSGESLVALINDILDFSKIEAGKIDLEAAPVHLRDCLDNVIYINRHAASVKGLKMGVDIDPELPPIVISDGARLQQILINLTANAVKFTSEGHVRLKASLDGTEGKNGTSMLRVRFSVSDTGIGIEADKIPRLFKPFSQADSSTTRRFGGTGLGLAICKKLCNLLGGEIWVESEGESGSTFHFTILAEPSDDPDCSQQQDTQFDKGTASVSVGSASDSAENGDASESSPSTEQTRGESQPLSLMVAEDNPVNQRIIKLLLKRLGYEPEFADNGLEALKLWESKSFDLIFMDVQMPNLDGYATTQEIRGREKVDSHRRRVHICALTADAMGGDRERCLRAGMDDYLSKPVDPQKIADLLEDVWKKKPTADPGEPIDRTNQWSPVSSHRNQISLQRRLTEDPRYMS